MEVEVVMVMVEEMEKQEEQSELCKQISLSIFISKKKHTGGRAA